MDEQQRGISIKMTPMTMLMAASSGKSRLFTMLDCPGHVNFNDEVTSAMRMADGVLLVIDAVEGVMVVTERAIKQAMAEGLPICVCISKVHPCSLVTLQPAPATLSSSCPVLSGCALSLPYSPSDAACLNVHSTFSPLFPCPATPVHLLLLFFSRFPCCMVCLVRFARACVRVALLCPHPSLFLPSLFPVLTPSACKCLTLGAHGASDSLHQINQVDRLITELKLPPVDAYHKLRHTLEEVNGIISAAHPADNPPLVDPVLGNVAFSAANSGWSFTLLSFAQMYVDICGAAMDTRDFAKRLWGDIYFHPDTRTFRRKPPVGGGERTFIQFILEPLYKIYSQLVGEHPKSQERMLAEFGVYLKPSTFNMDVKPLLHEASLTKINVSPPCCVTGWLPGVIASQL